MCSAGPRVLEAKFRPNQQYSIRRAPSNLAILLKNAAWIPQEGAAFVKPSQASRDLLPDGFPFDSGQHWLKAVEFGLEVEKKSEEARKRKAVAAELGFDDDDALADAQWFAGLNAEQRRNFKEEVERQARFELPEQQPNNPERRASKVAEQACEAPRKESEERTRSVQVGLSDIKAEAEQYLRHQYTNAEGETICQVCKGPLPFRLDDGRYYLERVEFVRDTGNRHFQNYLALCPNHAAMYQHAHGSADLIRDLLSDCDNGLLDVILAGTDETIYFTRTHLLDLKAILSGSEVEEKESEEGV